MPRSLQKNQNWRPGVSLRSDVSGGRIWVQNIKIDNKPRIVELGRFPEIGLPEARARAEQNSQKVASGVNILSTLRRSHEQHLKRQIAELNTRLKSDDPAPDADTAIAVSPPEQEPPATAPTSHTAIVRRTPKADSPPPPPAVAEASPAQDTPTSTLSRPLTPKGNTPMLPHENIRGRDYFS